MKVTCRLVGGLGNQLFIYAAARRLSIASGAELIIDQTSGFERDFEYRRFSQLNRFNVAGTPAGRRERLEPFSRVRRFIFRNLNAHRPFEMRTYLQQLGNDFDPRLLSFKCQGDVWLEGYWQSEQYFKDIEEVIRDDLQITPPVDDLNQQFATHIRANCSIAVHVRFFDNPDDVAGNNISQKYYEKAIEYMESKFPAAHYFIFSDKPDAALRRLNFPKNRFTVVSHNQGDHNAYADLWLMTLCRHFVIANSTFSWWGAWLSEHESKHVTAPGARITQGKMAWGFEGLLPDAWIKL